MELKDGTQELGDGRFIYLQLVPEDGHVVVEGRLTAAELRQIADWLDSQTGGAK